MIVLLIRVQLLFTHVSSKLCLKPPCSMFVQVVFWLRPGLPLGQSFCLTFLNTMSGICCSKVLCICCCNHIPVLLLWPHFFNISGPFLVSMFLVLVPDLSCFLLNVCSCVFPVISAVFDCLLVSIFRTVTWGFFLLDSTSKSDQFQTGCGAKNPHFSLETLLYLGTHTFASFLCPLSLMK